MLTGSKLTPLFIDSVALCLEVNCSPFWLNATLHYHLDSFSELDPEFVRIMKKSFYVDDLVTGDR